MTKRVPPAIQAAMLAAACIAAPALSAKTQTRALSPAALSAIDTLAAAELAKKVPGLSIAIAYGNQLVFSKAYGFADLQNRVPATPSTLFRTASVAKPLTATGVMALVEDGRLDLDAPVRRYCQAWPEKHPVITTRQLLGHLAGIRHYTKPGESAGKTTYFSIEESLVLFKNDALLHEPGSKYFYSTYGYSVLGCAIEGASGKPYIDYMTDRVFTRAGMTSTRQDFHYFVVPNRASGYFLLTDDAFKGLPASAQRVAKSGQIYNAELHDTSMKVPGGGLLSTAEDLVRFGIAVNTGALLKRETVETMWTEQKTTRGEATGYGLGWGVAPAQDGVRRFSHSGNQAGFASVMHVLPEVGLTYAIMVNLEDHELGPLSRGIAGVVRDHLFKRSQ